MKPQITFRRLHPDVRPPQPTDPGAWDIRAFLLSDTGRPNTLLIPPRTVRPVPTGLRMKLPPNYTLFGGHGPLLSKSVFTMELAWKEELQILLYNGGYESAWIKHEDIIAYVIAIIPIEAEFVEEVDGKSGPAKRS